MSYITETVGPYRPEAQRVADKKRQLAETHRRWAKELQVALATDLPPAQARALAEQTVAGGSGATAGELAVARAFLKANVR